MGQQQSTLGSGEVIVIDDNLQISGFRPLTTSVEEGHSRPIPPPQSRSQVLAELQGFHVQDRSPSANASLSLAGSKRSSETLDDAAVHQMQGETTAQKISQDVSGKEGYKQEDDNITTPFIQNSTPRKKRKLFSNEQAIELAQKISEEVSHGTHNQPYRGVANMDQNSVKPTGTSHKGPGSLAFSEDFDVRRGNTTSHRHGPFLQDDTDDDGERYQTLSPKSGGSSFDDADDQTLVNELARLHQQSVTSKVEIHNNEMPTPPDSPIQRKLQEENDSAEQSRLLRERKQAGQAAKPILSTNSSLPSSEVGGRSAMSEGNSYVFTHGDKGTRYKANKQAVGSLHRSDLSTRDPSSTNIPTSRSNGRWAASSESDADDSDIEGHFDVARDYLAGQRPAPQSRLRRLNHNTPRSLLPSHRHNPYARSAAEGFRTQDRHLDRSNGGGLAETGKVSQLEDGEDRLRALTRKTHEHSSAPRPPPSFARSASSSASRPQKFYGIDLSPQSYRPRVRSASPNSGRIVGADFDRALDVDDDESSTPKSDAFDNTGISILQDERPTRPLSMLEMMARKAQNSQQPAGRNQSQNFGPALELGVAADIDHEDEQQVRAEHERLKEQQKDLQSIESTTLAIASIRALGPLTAVEAKEEHEFRKFVGIVLDAKKSGKDRRARMTNIRANFIGRSKREYNVPEDEKVREEYVNLLGERRAEMLVELKEPLDDLVLEFRTKRTTMTAKRHNTTANKRKYKKLVKFADSYTDKETGRLRRDIPDGTEFELGEPTKPVKKKKKKTRPMGKEEKEILMLEERLRQVKATRTARFDDEHVPAPATAVQPDSESEVSEEEGGEEYVFNAGRNSAATSSFTCATSFPGGDERQNLEVDQDLDEINKLENERQGQDDSLAVSRSKPTKIANSADQGGAQGYDHNLIIQMQARRIALDLRQKEKSENIPFDDVAELSDSDVSVASTPSTRSSDTDSSASSDHPTTVQRFKYTVMGQFVGVETYKPEEEYILRTFHDLNLANEYVQKTMNSLAADHKAIAGDDWELRTRCRKGIFEQLLYLGEDESVQARVWVDREIIEVDMGKVAAKKARKAILGDAKYTWMVEWERIVNTTTDAVSDETVSPGADTTVPDVNGEEEDDLFGSPPPAPPPAPPIAPTPKTAVKHQIFRPTPDEVASNLFTTPAHANRAAKEIYINWYAQFFPDEAKPYYGRYIPASGSRYEGMLGQVDMACEEELGTLGEWGLGVWENEVESKDGGEGAEGVGDGEKGRETERMRVWVRRVGVQGPTN